MSVKTPILQTINLNGLPYLMVAITKPGYDIALVKVIYLNIYLNDGWLLF